MVRDHPLLEGTIVLSSGQERQRVRYNPVFGENAGGGGVPEPLSEDPPQAVPLHIVSEVDVPGRVPGLLTVRPIDRRVGDQREARMMVEHPAEELPVRVDGMWNPGVL